MEVQTFVCSLFLHSSIFYTFSDWITARVAVKIKAVIWFFGEFLGVSTWSILGRLFSRVWGFVWELWGFWFKWFCFGTGNFAVTGTIYLWRWYHKIQLSNPWRSRHANCKNFRHQGWTLIKSTEPLQAFSVYLHRLQKSLRHPKPKLCYSDFWCFFLRGFETEKLLMMHCFWKIC